MRLWARPQSCRPGGAIPRSPAGLWVPRGPPCKAAGGAAGCSQSQCDPADGKKPSAFMTLSQQGQITASCQGAGGGPQGVSARGWRLGAPAPASADSMLRGGRLGSQAHHGDAVLWWEGKGSLVALCSLQVLCLAPPSVFCSPEEFTVFSPCQPDLPT